MTCAEASALVARAGAIVTEYGAGDLRALRARRRLLPAAGNHPAVLGDRPGTIRKCFVGYTCRDKFNEGQGRD